MKHDPFQPVATILQFRDRQRSHINPASYRQGEMTEYDPMMSGSVEVTLPDGTFRVPATRHEDGSIETAEVIVAQIHPSLTERVGTLVFTPGHAEVAVVWSRPGEEPVGSDRVRLSVTDDDSVVRLLPSARRGAARARLLWKLNPETPVYFLKAYGLLADRLLPIDHDDDDTLASLIHRYGAEQILGSQEVEVEDLQTAL